MCFETSNPNPLLTEVCSDFLTPLPYHLFSPSLTHTYVLYAVTVYFYLRHISLAFRVAPKFHDQKSKIVSFTSITKKLSVFGLTDTKLF